VPTNPPIELAGRDSSFLRQLFEEFEEFSPTDIRWLTVESHPEA